MCHDKLEFENLESVLRRKRHTGGEKIGCKHLQRSNKIVGRKFFKQNQLSLSDKRVLNPRQ